MTGPARNAGDAPVGARSLASAVHWHLHIPQDPARGDRFTHPRASATATWATARPLRRRTGRHL